MQAEEVRNVLRLSRAPNPVLTSKGGYNSICYTFSTREWGGVRYWVIKPGIVVAKDSSQVIMRDWFWTPVETQRCQISCGVRTLSGLDGAKTRPEETLVGFVCKEIESYYTLVGYKANRKDARQSIKTFCIFSDNEELGNGAAFARYIRDYGLGSLVESKVEQNYNYSHERPIRTWIWTPDVDKILEITESFFNSVDKIALEKIAVGSEDCKENSNQV